MRLLGALIVCMAALVGCGATASGDPESGEPASPAFALSFKRGGGLTGGTESLVISAGRHAVATSTDTRAGDREVRFQIGAGRVRALQRGFRQAHFESIEAEDPAGYCADCYVYAIRYRGHSVELVDPEVPPRLSDVIGEIESVISTHTIPPNA